MFSSIHDYPMYSQYPLVTAQLQNKNLQLCYHSLHCTVYNSTYAYTVLFGCNETHAIHINQEYTLALLHPTMLTSSAIHVSVWEVMLTVTSCTDMKHVRILVQSSSTCKLHYRVCHKYRHKVYA